MGNAFITKSNKFYCRKNGKICDFFSFFQAQLAFIFMQQIYSLPLRQKNKLCNRIIIIKPCHCNKFPIGELEIVFSSRSGDSAGDVFIKQVFPVIF
jgi:hypothetical protein